MHSHLQAIFCKKFLYLIGIISITYIFFNPGKTIAGFGDFALNGYVKYLSSSTKIPVYKKTIFDQLIHSRINSRWYISDALTVALELRLRAFYGESLKMIPGFADQFRNHYDLMNLDTQFWKSGKSLGYGEVDRFYFDYNWKNFQVTVGRQRIAWSTSLVWNIIDLFNPQSILDFDYEEKPGADALRFQYYTGAVSKIEFAAKLNNDSNKRTFAGLWSFNFLEYDFFFIAAFANNRKVFGGAWSGNISGAGFRGEFKLAEAPSKKSLEQFPVPAVFGKSYAENKTPLKSFVLSGDYTFPNTLYLHAEILYNSKGKVKDAGVFQEQALTSGMLSPARWSLFHEISYDITPLIRGSVFAIFNPNDHSQIVVPAVTWSVVTNLDLMAIAFFPAGEQFSEYGDVGKYLFLRLKYSF